MISKTTLHLSNIRDLKKNTPHLSNIRDLKKNTPHLSNIRDLKKISHTSQTSAIHGKKKNTPHLSNIRDLKKNTPHLTNTRNLNLFSREQFTRKNGKKIRESFVKRLVHLSKGWSICQKGGPFVKRCGLFVKGVPERPLPILLTSDRKPKTNDQILPSPILFFPSKN